MGVQPPPPQPWSGGGYGPSGACGVPPYGMNPRGAHPPPPPAAVPPMYNNPPRYGGSQPSYPTQSGGNFPTAPPVMPGNAPPIMPGSAPPQMPGGAPQYPPGGHYQYYNANAPYTGTFSL